MNQVTELLRLVPGASIEDAVVRLTTLFDLMSGAKGFRTAEILRNSDEPELILVLHTWDDIEDWHTFRSSDTKMTFSASRPDFLYTFVPCGINWLLQKGEGSQEGDVVRREVLRGELEPAEGFNVLSSQTFAYQDYEPSLEGAHLRLTRLSSAPSALAATGDDVLADEVYESIKKHAVMPEQQKVAPQRV